jgi:glycosyltransferase involved in cell wall biosynthesis
MAESAFISICIPAYKNPEFLTRLLDSIAIQTFKDFEVIITDDSPDGEIAKLAENYSAQFHIQYFRNTPPAGTPENWNRALQKAGGQWIKLMHDDDWFSNKASLERFAAMATEHQETSFIYSAYEKIIIGSDQRLPVLAGKFWLRRLSKNPTILFARNIIGPPSVTMQRAGIDLNYDKQLKWVVDIDYYIRWLKNSKAFYIAETLINVGISDQQVTMDCFRRRPIEIPENFYLLNKVGRKNLRNILVYDAWWRLMRNLEIRNPSEIRESGYSGEIDNAIISMIKWQSGLPLGLLRWGVFSKCIMLLHYILNYGKIQH